MAPGDTDLWVRRYHPSPESRVQLVCLPHAGGSASFYFPVSAALAPEIEVLAVQYPGRQDRHLEPCIDDMAEYVDRVHAALASVLGDHVAFFGHSMGAILAFELARRRQLEGKPVTALIASGRRGPETYRNENVHLQKDGQILAEMRKMSGTDARVFGDEELVSLIMPAIRADYAAVEKYQCERGATVTCPILVLTGDQDSKVTTDEARAWKDNAAGSFDHRIYPGGHFYLTRHAPAVIAEIKDMLRPVSAQA
jgi:surfactin synthase thioesterase subunit